jgi:aminoglycoside 3-N-acetyltransferase
MPWTSASLANDLRELGLEPGSAVLTHSSFKSLGQGEGGPAAVVQGILEAIGSEGTALFPTHTWENAGPETPPTFDVRSSPSRLIGVIPEVARQWPGGVRSVHPTHSVVALGADAEWFTEGHFDAGMCGIGSPYDRLCEGGSILLLGVDQERNTSLHMVEEILEIPGAFTDYAVCRVTGYDGVERLRPSRFHTWRPRRFMVLDEEVDRLGIQRRGRVGEATCRLIDAGRLRDFALDRLRADQDYFWE